MRSGANQLNNPSFDVWQKHVLLGLVEPVNFINEQNGGLAFVLEAIGGGGEHPAHVGNVRFHAAEPFEMAASAPGDDLGQGGLARARRTIKDKGLDPIRLDGPPKELPWPKDMGLASKFFQIPGPHPSCQRLAPERGLLVRGILYRLARRVRPGLLE